MSPSSRRHATCGTRSVRPLVALASAWSPPSSLRRVRDHRPGSRSRHARCGHPRPRDSAVFASRATAPMPPDAPIDDGLTSQEAVAIALWNSPSFQATLADLGIARADLVEAGLLRNPVFSLLFPVGPKQLEWTLQFPFEALWQRPRRVAAAQLNAQAVGERLVWDALSLVAQTRTAHADAVIADRRLQLTIENADLVQRLTGDHRGAAARRRHQRARSALGAQRRGPRAGRAARRRTRSEPRPADAGGAARPRYARRPAPAGARAAACRPVRLRDRSGATRGRAGLAARCSRRGDRHRSRGAAGAVGALARVDADRDPRRQRKRRRRGGGRARRESRCADLLAQPGAHQPRRGGNRAGEPSVRGGPGPGGGRRAVRDHAACSRPSRRSAPGETRSCPSLEIEQRQAESAYQAGEIPLFSLLDVSRRLVDGRTRLLDAEADLQRATIALERSIGRSCRHR